jgi:hypothetical protein
MNPYQLLLISFLLLLGGCGPTATSPEWPEITSEAKPWTRWWWHGSAVTKAGITSELESLNQAGIGGVEITPIFGVRGTEDQFIDFLSPEWMEMLVHTLAEAKRLGMGVDMATGTGWPFGGPWVTDTLAAKYMTCQTWELAAGERLSESVRYEQEGFVRGAGGRLTLEDIVDPVADNQGLQDLAIDQVRFAKEMPLVALLAYSEQGAVEDLTEQVENGQLNWTAPAGNWTLYALYQGWHGKMVERAAPGGEGLVIDHFSQAALRGYLAPFDSAFAGQDLSALRAFFNDSYEVDDARGEANWTPGFLEAFEKVNGYDLREQIPTLLDQTASHHPRVLTDYRATVEHLLYEHFTKEWKAWGESKGALIRNQAHGSPANILDLYATVDIPETEGTDMLKIKFASSAANVMGKRLTSSESATWLKDHFQSNLADVKQNLERYFLGGVNHVFYHGTAYSPDTAQWPGWLFYAAIHANDRNSWWGDFPALNLYVARVQSFLQNSQPDNDILLYFPIYDRYAEPGPGLLEHFDIRGNFNQSAVKQVGETLWEKGYTFDLISDRQLQDLTVSNGRIQSHGNGYQTILVPATEYIPLETMQALQQLAAGGAKVLFHQQLPADVPGLGRLKERQQALATLKQQLNTQATVDASLEALLSQSGVKPEPMFDLGLQVIRKRNETGYLYFVANWTDQPVSEYVSLAKGQPFAALFDPMEGKKGTAKVKDGQVLLQLLPGESCLLQTSAQAFAGEAFPYWQDAGEASVVDGPWEFVYLRGGPAQPGPQVLTQLASWPAMGEDLASFSGTMTYATEVAKPEGDAVAYRLDLGEVSVSAAVSLNGHLLAKLIGPTYSVVIPAEAFTEGNNDLQIAVSNLMANRIIDMDQRGIPYRKFYNTNFPAHDAANRDPETGLFHADHWAPTPSGLLGPVHLTPLTPHP